MTIKKSYKGKKRICEQCAGRFYDLNKKPVKCPICHAELNEIDDYLLKNQPIQNNKYSDDSSLKLDKLDEEKVPNEENEESEFISLEEVEEENN